MLIATIALVVLLGVAVPRLVGRGAGVDGAVVT